MLRHLEIPIKHVSAQLIAATIILLIGLGCRSDSGLGVLDIFQQVRTTHKLGDQFAKLLRDTLSDLPLRSQTTIRIFPYQVEGMNGVLNVVCHWSSDGYTLLPDGIVWVMDSVAGWLHPTSDVGTTTYTRASKSEADKILAAIVDRLGKPRKQIDSLTTKLYAWDSIFLKINGASGRVELSTSFDNRQVTTPWQESQFDPDDYRPLTVVPKLKETRTQFPHLTDTMLALPEAVGNFKPMHTLLGRTTLFGYPGGFQVFMQDDTTAGPLTWQADVDYKASPLNIERFRTSIINVLGKPDGSLKLKYQEEADYWHRPDSQAIVFHHDGLDFGIANAIVTARSRAHRYLTK